MLPFLADFGHKPAMPRAAGNLTLAAITRDLAQDVDRLKFRSPVAYVYNPLNYAERPYAKYLHQYAQGQKETLLIGMNPGPFGMAQTGIPFGEVTFARDWLKVEAPVDKPPREHPKRPIEGFACARSEVSGRRLWGWVADTFRKPERFFERYFIANYCPLCFIEVSGRNLTPDKLPAHEREPLLAACDRALRRTVEYFSPKFVVGIGGFAEKRARVALEGLDIRIGRILHPSPASPIANRGWEAQARRDFAEIGIKL